MDCFCEYLASDLLLQKKLKLVRWHGIALYVKMAADNRGFSVVALWGLGLLGQ